MYIHIYICIYIYIYLYSYVYIYVYICINTQAYNTCSRNCLSVTPVCIFITYTYMHVCMYTHTNTLINTHTYACLHCCVCLVHVCMYAYDVSPPVLSHLVAFCTEFVATTAICSTFSPRSSHCGTDVKLDRCRY